MTGGRWSLRILHNPRYAGVFVYGRSRTRRAVDGRSVVEPRPREQWHAFLPEAHARYLTWEDFERNQRQLHANAQACGHDRRHSPPREGPALLQGLILCGRCGRRMTVRSELASAEPANVRRGAQPWSVRRGLFRRSGT